MTQTQAAAALGVTLMTVSRWERGQSVKDRDLAAAANLYDAWDLLAEYVEDKRLINLVPRGTLAVREDASDAYAGARRADGSIIATDSLPNRLEVLAKNFEREMIRAGATNDEVDYIHFATHNPESAKLFYMGGTGQPLSLERQEKELALLMEALRVWVMARIAERQAAERQKPRPKTRSPES